MDQIGGRAKGWACPHCRRHGTLNRHGRVRGLGEREPGKDAVRGQRFFCSNRGWRRGCGKTFTVLLATLIRRATVRTGELWRFYKAKLGGASVVGAWEGLGSRFSVEAAYGWWRRWRRGQFAVRSILAHGRDPPRGSVAESLGGLFGADDPVGNFQLMEQRSWP